MIAVDTNVVVRLFTRDDPEQFDRAEACFADADVFIPDSVLLETAWVLESVYSFDDRQIAAALRKLLGLPPDSQFGLADDFDRKSEPASDFKRVTGARTANHELICWAQVLFVEQKRGIGNPAILFCEDF